MATYYWVGGSGTWDVSTTTNWSLTSGGAGGAGVPTTSDSVEIDGNSGSGTTTTGVGATAGQVVFNNANITLLLGADFATTGQLAFQQGALNLNNFNAYADNMNVGGTGVRSITSGSGQFFLTGQNATILAGGVLTNLTYADRATYNISANASSGTRVVSHGFISNQAVKPNFNITAGTDTLTFNPDAFNVNFTGFSGTLNNSGRNIYGNLVLSATMTLAAGTNKTDFRGTTAGNTVTTNGRLIDFPLEFVATGSSWILQDNLTLGATRALTLTAGTLNANGNNITVGAFVSTGTSVRTLTLGSGTWTVQGDGATAWNTATTGLTVSASTGVINMTSANAKTFVGSGKTWPTLNQGGAGALTITGANTFANVTNTVQPATITFPASTTTTVDLFSVSGTSGNLITLNSSSAGTQATLSDASGVNSARFCDIKDINATGGASWIAFTENGNVNSGNNAGWGFTRQFGRYIYTRRKNKRILP
jgi:hypothetical protein